MTVIYHESDARINALEGLHLAVLGYDRLARSFALNLQDSGLDLIVGSNDEKMVAQARTDGFEVRNLAEAARSAEIKLLLVPDETMSEVYLTHVSPGLRAGDTLVFASGYSVAFGFVEPPPFVDVIMVAPRTVGAGVREGFLTGKGFLSFVSVAQDSTGKAWDRLLGLALALGSLRAGALEVSFRQEAELDLFVQQTVLPTLQNLIFTAADLLIKEGYPPEAALLDLYASGELGYVMDKAADFGMTEILDLYPATGQYSMLSRMDRLQDPKLRRQLEVALEEVRSGKFSEEWAAEYGSGYVRLETLRRRRRVSALLVFEQRALAMLRQATPPKST